MARQRRFYWRCAAVGAVAGFFCGYPGIGRGIGGAVFVIFAMALGAMRGTPYLKIGGKIYAFSARDRRAAKDDVPSTFQEDLAGAADLIQRRYGDPEIPDTTGRNVTEALNAFNRRFGGKDAPVINEPNASDAGNPPACPAQPLRVSVPGSGGSSPRVILFLLGLPLVVGGVLMAVNPPPPVRSPHRVTGLGVACAVLGVYLLVKALRTRAPEAVDTAQQPTLVAGSAHPHRHAAPPSIANSAREIALYLGVFAAGAGLLWWGASAGLLAVVGMSVVVLGPALLIPAAALVARLREARRA